MTDWKVYNDYISARGKECEITIERRPAYCDRGNYIAKVHATGDLFREMDDSDGWPRYYFDLSIAQRECEAWLAKRGQLRDGEIE
jgi:hypothetical protein